MLFIICWHIEEQRKTETKRIKKVFNANNNPQKAGAAS